MNFYQDFSKYFKIIAVAFVAAFTVLGSASGSIAKHVEPYYDRYDWNFNGTTSEAWISYGMNQRLANGRMILDSNPGSNGQRSLKWNGPFYIVMPTHSHKFIDIKMNSSWNSRPGTATLMLKVDRGGFYDYLPLTIQITSREVVYRVDTQYDYEQYAFVGIEVLLPEGMDGLHIEIDRISAVYELCYNNNCDES